MWMVATCRRSMKLAYEIFVACIHIHTEMDRCLGFGFMEGCLRLLGQHLRLVRATIEAERTLDVKLLQRFELAYLC